MPKRCVAVWCSNTTSDTVTLYQFPKDDNLKKEWTKQVQRTRDKWQPSHWSVLCSEHFTEDCFEVGPSLKESFGFKVKFKKVLKEGAIPTIFHRKLETEPEAPSAKKKRISAAVTRSRKLSRRSKKMAVADILHEERAQSEVPAQAQVPETDPPSPEKRETGLAETLSLAWKGPTEVNSAYPYDSRKRGKKRPRYSTQSPSSTQRIDEDSVKNEKKNNCDTDIFTVPHSSNFAEPNERGNINVAELGPCSTTISNDENSETEMNLKKRDLEIVCGNCHRIILIRMTFRQTGVGLIPMSNDLSDSDKERVRNLQNPTADIGTVTIGNQLDRWRELREEKELATDMDVAAFLLDCYDKLEQMKKQICTPVGEATALGKHSGLSTINRTRRGGPSSSTRSRRGGPCSSTRSRRGGPSSSTRSRRDGLSSSTRSRTDGPSSSTRSRTETERDMSAMEYSFPSSSDTPHPVSPQRLQKTVVEKSDSLPFIVIEPIKPDINESDTSETLSIDSPTGLFQTISDVDVSISKAPHIKDETADTDSKPEISQIIQSLDPDQIIGSHDLILECEDAPVGCLHDVHVDRFNT